MLHLKYKFRKPESEILELARKATRQARNYCDDIEFSPEDATRSSKGFLFKVIEAAIKEGARTINIPDTVGYSYPQEVHSLITDILNNVPNINKAVIAIHCHDDLGMAVANSLSAVLAGALGGDVDELKSQISWIPPKWAWVDPLKDRKAEKLAVDAGFKSRSAVIEEEGSDPELVDDRIRKDQERAEKLGLSFASGSESDRDLEDEGEENESSQQQRRAG